MDTLTSWHQAVTDIVGHLVRQEEPTLRCYPSHRTRSYEFVSGDQVWSMSCMVLQHAETPELIRRSLPFDRGAAAVVEGILDRARQEKEALEKNPWTVWDWITGKAW